MRRCGLISPAAPWEVKGHEQRFVSLYAAGSGRWCFNPLSISNDRVLSHVSDSSVSMIERHWVLLSASAIWSYGPAGKGTHFNRFSAIATSAPFWFVISAQHVARRRCVSIVFSIDLHNCGNPPLPC